jgi:hypothetical protein
MKLSTLKLACVPVHRLTHCSTSTHALRELSKYEDEKTFRNIENNIREHLNIDLYVNEERHLKFF